MSSSSTLRRIATAGLLLVFAAALGACSFSPVYSGTLANQPLLNLAYAKPASRLEQVVYQELALRFGTASSDTAPLAKVTVSTSAVAAVMTSTSNPNVAYETTATVTLVITRRDGSDIEPMTFTRSATATYTTRSQVLADAQAAAEANERAAKAATESLRLAMLASLSR